MLTKVRCAKGGLGIWWPGELHQFQVDWSAHQHSNKLEDREYLVGNISKYHRYWVAFEKGVCVSAGVFTRFSRLDATSVAWSMAYAAEEFDRNYFVQNYGVPNLVEPRKWCYNLENEKLELYFDGQKCVKACAINSRG